MDPARTIVTAAESSPTEPAPRPQPSILDIQAYVPGRSAVGHTSSDLAVRPVMKLSSNETPLGPSPVAVAAAARTLQTLARYPEDSAQSLREALASRYQLDPERIICGTGSDDILTLVARAYLGPGDEAIYTTHGFLVYRIAILGAGGRPIIAPERDYTAHVDAILAAVTPRTRMVFLANPNNPTGTYCSAAEIARLRAGLPTDVVLVLDGAYAEYVEAADYEPGLALARDTTNTIMTRTFSKVYGLAALRVGWAYGPAAMIGVLNRIRNPFNVSSAGIAAAMAAIEDHAHTQAAVAHNTEWRGWLAKALNDIGLLVTPSVANFVLVHLPAGLAGDADAFLLDRNIIVRRVASYGLPDALRISIGLEAENRAVAAALAEFVATRAAVRG